MDGKQLTLLKICLIVPAVLGVDRASLLHSIILSRRSQIALATLLYLVLQSLLSSPICL